MADIINIIEHAVGFNSSPSVRDDKERSNVNQAVKLSRTRSRGRLRRLRAAVEIRQRSLSKAVLNLALLITTGLLTTTIRSSAAIWQRGRSTQWWEVDVMIQFTERQWQENFRMTRAAFQLLCNQLHPHIIRSSTTMREPVGVAKQVAMTLYRLATGESFRSIGNLFGVGRTTAYDAFWSVCHSICTYLKPVYIRRPKGEEVKRMLRIFELKFGFPMCGGAVDGTHIPIIAPDLYHTDYYNRKGWYSIILQGLVNHEYKFIDFDIGHPGKCHDSFVFESSKLYKKLMQGTFYPNFTRTIEGKEIPIVILGDSAYSLSNCLMKPYPEGLATAEQKRFNERLSRARILVEHAFGRLKGRWRCIMKRNDSRAHNVHFVVTACIVLHNFCETWKMEYEDDNQARHHWDQPNHDFNHDNHTEPDGDGTQIRNALMHYFANN